MSNRTAKFVSAIFASLLAGTPLATLSHGATRAADDCLSGPKATAPDGGHWYYRIDHATQRHCWYVRSEDRLAQVTEENSSPSAKPVAPKTDTAAQRSIADARAELPMARIRVAPDTGAATAQRSAANAADAAGLENKSRADAGTANTRASLVAARWPGQTEVSSPINPEPATASSVANVPPNSRAAAAPIATVTLAAADSSSRSQFGSIQMLLTVVMGALSIAAVMGGAVFRFGGRQEIHGRRRVNWGLADVRIADIPRDLRAADDPNRRIAEMLARLPRRAVN